MPPDKHSTPTECHGRVRSTSQSQQDKNRSTRSAGRPREGPGGESRPTARSVAQGKNPPNGSAAKNSASGCIDTLILTRKLDAAESLRLTGRWESRSRRHPGTYRPEEWSRHDQSHLGWRVDYQEERRVLEIRLSVPRVMGRQETNYPLRRFNIEALDLVSGPMARVLGIRPGRIGWRRFGVREVAFTADLLVHEKHIPYKLGIFNAVATLPHAGERVLRDTSVRWTTGSREVQLYAKAEELRRNLGRKDYESILRTRPELDRVLRLEVTLGSSEIRDLFGLRSGWLPMLPLITERVAAYVLVAEVRKRFRLDREVAVVTSEQDSTAGLAAMLRASVRKRNETLSFSALCQLVVAHQLLAVHRRGRTLTELFGVSAAQVGKLKRRLGELGFPPGSSPQSFDHACVSTFRKMFLEQYPSRLQKPVLTHDQEHGMTIDAPWLDADDTTRELPGMSVDEYVPT